MLHNSNRAALVMLLLLATAPSAVKHSLTLQSVVGTLLV